MTARAPPKARKGLSEGGAVEWSKGSNRMIDFQRQARLDLVDIPDPGLHSDGEMGALAGAARHCLKNVVPRLLARHDFLKRVLASGRTMEFADTAVATIRVLIRVSCRDQRPEEVRGIRLVDAECCRHIRQPNRPALRMHVIESPQSTVQRLQNPHCQQPSRFQTSQMHLAADKYTT